MTIHETPESRYEQVTIKQPKIEAPKQWYPPPEAMTRPLFCLVYGKDKLLKPTTISKKPPTALTREVRDKDLNFTPISIDQALVFLNESERELHDSLTALRLVNIKDLSSQNIPMGQRQLIVHIAHALGADDSTSCATGNSVTTSSASTGNTEVSLTTNRITDQQVTSTQLPAAGQQQQPQASNAYSQTLLNRLLNQQAQVSAATGNSSTSAINKVNIVQLT